LAKIAEEEDLGRPEDRQQQTNLPLAVLAHIIQTREGDGLTHHTYSDIGRFTVFPVNHFKRMFPTKPFGTL